MPQQRSKIGPVFSTQSTNLQYLRSISHWMLAGVSFRNAHFRSDCSWSAHMLVIAALVWAWANPLTLLDRFSLARRIVIRLFPKNETPHASYQAFIKLLRKHTDSLLPPIVQRLRRRMAEDLKAHFTIYGRAVFAVDGTKVLLPKTKSNERAWAKTRKRKQTRTDVGAKTKSGHLRNKVPQFYVTVLWNLGTRLMWDWRAGPSNASETEHLEEMLDSLPASSMLVGDAGSIGYELWQKILGSGHDWLVRVGANVKLLKKLGYVREYGSTVYYWPNEKRKKSQPPIVFRLVVLHGGKQPVYLLTNLSASKLPDRQVSDLYRRRWGIEVFQAGYTERSLLYLFAA